MKYLVYIMFTACWVNAGFSQNIVPGYYVKLNNDTIKANIKTNVSFFGGATNDYFITIIEVIDNSGKIQKFKPDDIKSYGFTENGVTHVMYSKPTKKGKNKFLGPVVKGLNSSLYKYSISTTGGVATLNNYQVFYTLERTDGNYMFLNNVRKKGLKDDLKAFFKDYPAAMNQIVLKFNHWLDFEKDLKELLFVVNSSSKS